MECIVAEVGAVEGMVVDPVGRALYWTSGAALAVLRASLRAGETAAAVRVVRLAPGDRPRGIDVDSCDE